MAASCFGFACDFVLSLGFGFARVLDCGAAIVYFVSVLVC